MIGIGIRSGIKNAVAAARRRAIYRQFKDYTMISESVFCDNLALAETVRDIPGCVVECGVWRGGMSAGICRVLGNEREYHLFDSFDGLPAAKLVDGAAAIKWQNDTKSPGYYDNCSATPDFAESAMKVAEATSYKLWRGWFDETLPHFGATPIVLLRLDADWYDSTMVCLKYLFNLVVEKGVIIVDDYYTWDGCSRAVHDFLSEKKATERIHSYRKSTCYMIKTAQLDTEHRVNDD
jgi:O-methyltransferase